MSAPPKFATLPDAIAAYLAGRSRRWADVDGWQIDLEQAANPCAVSRPGADDEPVFVRGVPMIVAEAGTLPYGCDGMFVAAPSFDEHDREVYDRGVALNIAAELSQAVEVLPDLAVPSEAGRVLTEDEDGAVYYTTRSGKRVKIMEAPQPVERCPWCGRPWDGAK